MHGVDPEFSYWPLPPVETFLNGCLTSWAIEAASSPIVDPEQQYFAEGITEDLTTDLSRIAGMLVISRNTAFTYRNKPIDTKQIGRELGVRYVLEGSVRRSISQIRVNAQLSRP
jgi:TolB-like protein